MPMAATRKARCSSSMSGSIPCWRAKAFGIDPKQHTDSGCLTIHRIDPPEPSPSQFAGAVRFEVQGMTVGEPLAGFEGVPTGTTE